MDLRIPVLDGWQVARRLKAAEETRAIPVIALSAHAMPGDSEKALEAGYDDYDAKPVNLKASGRDPCAVAPGGRAVF